MSGASISTQQLVLALQASCTGTTSSLYWHYKHLVLALQGILYWHYKHLVLALQGILYWHYKVLVVCVLITFRCTANAVVLIH